MSWASSEVVAIITFLLPGFVAATIFYSLTSHPKPSELDRVIQALVFTIVGQAVAWLILLPARLFWTEAPWLKDSEVFVSVLSAVVIALVAVYFSNHDTIHRLLRHVGITKENSYPSEWYSAFYSNTEGYVVLHLKGERRLYGWPQEWPSRPDEGHFIIAEVRMAG